MTSSSAARSTSVQWRRTSRRLAQHYLPFSLVTALILTVFLILLPGENTLQKWSMATAYAGLGLLGFTLLVGVMNVLRSRPNPTSSDLRRDAGILGAVIMFIHVIVGSFVHMGGNPLYYFFFPSGEAHLIPLRYDAFGLANWVGLLGTLILVLLFATSNDLSLRWLGKGRWKTLQRANYFLFGFVALHGVAYQILEKRTLPLIVLFGLMVASVVILQVAGFIRRRKEKKMRRL